jgi:hypothetical protein
MTKLVDFIYPIDSGLRQKLAKDGYKFACSSERQVRGGSISMDGRLSSSLTKGTPTLVHFKDRYEEPILLKKRMDQAINGKIS